MGEMAWWLLVFLQVSPAWCGPEFGLNTLEFGEWLSLNGDFAQ